MNNRNEKKQGPSCLGCILLMAVIVVGLKYVYWKYPKEPSTVPESAPQTEQSEPAEQSRPDGESSPIGSILDSLIGKLRSAAESVTGITDKKPETEANSEGKPEPERIPLYDALYDALKDGAQSVGFDYDCSDALFDTFRQLCDEHPELFWLDGGGNMQISTFGTEVTVDFRPGRMLTTEEIPAAKTELEQAAAAILSEIPAEASDYDIILYVHDRLVTDTEYDREAADNFAGTSASLGMSANAYGCLVLHRAVCSGYSAAFRMLMNEAGIPCLTVTGYDSREGAPHAWNCVQSDGDWYFIDVTWDDPTYEEEEISRGVNRECFLITTEELLKTHTVGEGQTVPECTATRDNYYVKNGMMIPAYSYEAAAELIRNQLGNDGICLKFPDAEEAAAACADLFDGQRIYEIVPEAGSVRYSMGSTGVLYLWIE